MTKDLSSRTEKKNKNLVTSTGQGRPIDLLLGLHDHISVSSNAWFPSLRIRSSVPVSPLSVAKVRKNNVHP